MMPPNDFPKQLINEMKNAIGTKDPIEYFQSLTTAFEMLFDRLSCIEKQLEQSNQKADELKTQFALAIHWDSAVALTMLSKQIDILRQNKEMYSVEITALKAAHLENKITQNYNDFCEFWKDTLGYHPFINYQ